MVRDGEHELADDRHVVVLVGERVERDADRSLERVLDRHDRAVDAAVVDGEDRVADGRQPDELGLLAAVQRRARGLLRERAGGPEIAEPHQDFSAMRSASSSSGESLSSPLPSDTCLAYSRAWSRWWIDESTTPLRELSSSAIEVDWRPDISL